MSHDLSKSKNIDNAVYPDVYYQYNFSKKSSDAFTNALILTLNERTNTLELIMPNKKSENNHNQTLKGTKPKCKEILRQFGYEKINREEQGFFGISELILLFSELNKEGFCCQDIPKSHTALCISILTGFQFDEVYNRMAHVYNKDIKALFIE